jgi:hypothetical protein
MAGTKPGSTEFGNDFIHAVARCALTFGWNAPEFLKLVNRIANLFRDLSCLIGVIYYCNWLVEHRVEAVPLSDPGNIRLTAAEFATMLQSPELLRRIRAREQNNGEKPPASARQARPARKRPDLRVIEGDGADFGGFSPLPAT